MGKQIRVSGKIIPEEILRQLGEGYCEVKCGEMLEEDTYRFVFADENENLRAFDLRKVGVEDGEDVYEATECGGSFCPDGLCGGCDLPCNVE